MGSIGKTITAYANAHNDQTLARTSWVCLELPPLAHAGDVHHGVLVPTVQYDASTPPGPAAAAAHNARYGDGSAAPYSQDQSVVPAISLVPTPDAYALGPLEGEGSAMPSPQTLMLLGLQADYAFDATDVHDLLMCSDFVERVVKPLNYDGPAGVPKPAGYVYRPSRPPLAAPPSPAPAPAADVVAIEDHISSVEDVIAGLQSITNNQRVRLNNQATLIRDLQSRVAALEGKK